MLKISVFASGDGSNFQAIIDSDLNIDVDLLVCDKPHAKVIERAKKRNIDVLIVNYQEGQAKVEAIIIKELKKRDIDFIVLAGYLRILSNNFINHFTTIINIHPSLLPKYKGLHAIDRALDNNDEYIGVSVHHVSEEVDDGLIIRQEQINVKNLSRDEVYQQVHQLEHKLYLEVIKEFSDER